MGTDSQQTARAIGRGMEMLEGLSELGRDREADAAGARADLLETEAEGRASEARRRAEKQARNVRAGNERRRSAESARWGGSNLEMSGSKALVKDAKRLKDRQEEEDVLFEGEQAADGILGTARVRANSLRGGSSGGAYRSLLSLGSSVYGRRN